MSCPICNSTMALAFSAKVMEQYDARFDYCDRCGFMRVRNPTWLAEAYADAITLTDTGLVMRNLAVAQKLSAVLYAVIGERGQGIYNDAAGGYGLLARLMRDYGFDFFWSDKYCENLFARGFEYAPERGACKGVTAVEVMEHVEDPLEFVTSTLAETRADTFIFTTELFAGPPPDPQDWWYYCFDTGQHIAFYQKRTLEHLASTLGMKFSTGGGIHVFSRVSLNEPLLRLVTGRLSRLVAMFVRRRLGPRLMGDHVAMKAVLARRGRSGDMTTSPPGPGSAPPPEH
jgi:hypothetical protein